MPIVENDHDLLIQVNTKLEIFLQTQAVFLGQMKDVSDRVSKLETKDRGDSERLQAISTSVQQSLANNSRINEHAILIDNLSKQIDALSKKSSFTDQVNMVVTAISSIIAAAIGYYFSPR